MQGSLMINISERHIDLFIYVTRHYFRTLSGVTILSDTTGHHLSVRLSY